MHIQIIFYLSQKETYVYLKKLNAVQKKRTYINHLRHLRNK